MFASGSQARGCHVEIRNSSIQMNIMRSGSPLSHTAEQTVTGLTPGSYEVFIFDWERDGSLSSTPSYVGHVNVTSSYVNHVNVTEQPDLLSSVPPTTRKLLKNWLSHFTSLVWWKGRFSGTNLKLELFAIQPSAPVVIMVKVNKCKQALLFIHIHY